MKKICIIRNKYAEIVPKTLIITILKLLYKLKPFLFFNFKVELKKKKLSSSIFQKNFKIMRVKFSMLSNALMMSKCHKLYFLSVCFHLPREGVDIGLKNILVPKVL